MSLERAVELQVLAARPHLFIPARIDPSGRYGPTRSQTQGEEFRRTSWGRYLPASIERTTEQRIVEAASVLPEYGGVTGWASLHWQRATRWFPGTAADGAELDVSLAVAGDDIRPQTGIAVSAERLDPRDLIVVDGISVTTAARSACYEMRYAPSVRAAARVLSMSAYDDLVSVEEMADYASRHSGWTGIPRCRAAIAFAEENVWSPAELDMVLVWRIDAELPRPLCNQPVFDRSARHIGTPDLLDVEAGVVGQYRGGLHLSGTQRAVDERAAEGYRDVGLEYFSMLADDRGKPAQMAQRMHAARARARWEAESTRRWTIDPPAWWTPTTTVASRRALSAEQRKKMLRYRTA